MNKKLLDEIILAIQSINEEIFNKIDDDYYNHGIFCELITDGTSAAIRFMNNVIWTDDDNERVFIEAINEYENLELFLRRQIRSTIKEINNLVI